MSTFSANTRVELTGEGWLYLAAGNAKAAARADNPAGAANLRRIAKDQASRAANALRVESGTLLPESSGCK